MKTQSNIPLSKIITILMVAMLLAGMFVSPAAAAPSTDAAHPCPTIADIEALGKVETWLYEGGDLAGAHVMFGVDFTATDVPWGWSVDALHKDGQPVPAVKAGYQASLWIKSVCRPIAAVTSTPVDPSLTPESSTATPTVTATPSATATVEDACTVPTLDELKALSVPDSTFTVLSDKGVDGAGVHLTFADDWAKPCWVDQINKDTLSIDVAPAGAEVTVWALEKYRPLK